MSLDNYNQLIKSARNVEYLAKLDKSMEQIKSGFGEVHEEKNLQIIVISQNNKKPDMIIVNIIDIINDKDNLYIHLYK